MAAPYGRAGDGDGLGSSEEELPSVPQLVAEVNRLKLRLARSLELQAAADRDAGGSRDAERKLRDLEDDLEDERARRRKVSGWAGPRAWSACALAVAVSVAFRRTARLEPRSWRGHAVPSPVRCWAVRRQVP